MSVDFNASFSGSAETFGAKMTETPASMTASMKETGGGSASNYEALRNKPKINGHELIGDMTPARSAKAPTTASTVWLRPCATISSAERQQTKQPARLPACRPGR